MNTPRLTQQLNEVVASVRILRTGFAATAPRVWTPDSAAAELSVQTGHVAHCVLARLGADITDLHDPARPIIDLGDELADVVLSAISVAVLAGVVPDLVAPPRPPAGSVVDALLRLVRDAGVLAEAAMIGHGSRHVPTGTPPSVPAAAAVVLDDCQRLADQFGLDLVAEFRAMVADATGFLARHGGDR